MRTADDLWRAWIDATTNEQPLPVEAKAHAETLLDVITQHGIEPEWDRRIFLNWCDREGLLVRGT